MKNKMWCRHSRKRPTACVRRTIQPNRLWRWINDFIHLDWMTFTDVGFYLCDSFLRTVQPKMLLLKCPVFNLTVRFMIFCCVAFLKVSWCDLLLTVWIVDYVQYEHWMKTTIYWNNTDLRFVFHTGHMFILPFLCHYVLLHSWKQYRPENYANVPPC